MQTSRTRTRDRTSPGINPATMGTSIVANDQANTPTSRTLLQLQDDDQQFYLLSNI